MMQKQRFVLSTMLATLLVLTTLAGLFWLGMPAAAAPPPAEMAQPTTQNFQYVSVSGLAFVPVQPNSVFFKDPQRQLLGLDSADRVFAQERNVFVAPLTLPDQAELRTMTIFGEDYDSQGEIRVRLKRCDHSQARCVSLGETSSSAVYTAGLFETTRVSLQNERVDNGLFNYFLELELTALSNSGLRSVRLEIVTRDPDAAAGTEQRWQLSGNVTSFPLPNSGLAQARICTDDLSGLDNPTHYPFVVVDERSIPLSSNSCVTVWGQDIEIRRRLNTGPSSGTFQILR